MTKTEKATEIIIIQSPVESTLVERRLPISMEVSGIETSANWTKNNNRANEHKNA